MDPGALAQRVGALGLFLVGGFTPDASDRIPAGSLVVIGNGGRALWPAFQGSGEAADGQPDPLNRWIERQIDAVAQDLGAASYYPHQGPPYLPFQEWARRADRRIGASPLGLAIHPEFGLWWALRAALLLPPGAVEFPDRGPGEPPCTSCAGRPCLSACPVDAFRPGGYDVAACAGHLEAHPGGPCLSTGCAARQACPVGREHVHAAPHAAFHMAAFLNARRPSPG